MLTQGRHLWRGPALVMVFLLTLSGTCWCLGQLWPRVESLFIIGPKLAHLAAYRDRYDTLFIGSSHVQVQIDPVVFDATTAAQGRPTHSFNAGVLALFSPENAFLCEQIKALHLQGLRQVFVEMSGLEAGRNSPEGERTIAWHNGHRTLLLWRWAWYRAEKEQSHLEKLAGKPPKSRHHLVTRLSASWRRIRHVMATTMAAWPQMAPDLRAFLANMANLGEGAARSSKVLFLPPPESHEQQMGPAENGYFEVPAMTDAKVIATFQKALANRSSPLGREVKLDPVSQENLEDILGCVRSMGAELILFQSPNSSSSRPVPSRAIPAPLLNFSDLDRWPQLYEMQNRHDDGHLSKSGAAIFSRALAEEWLKAPFRGDQPR